MILGIIPARYASSRMPGKPLADVAGKTMIQRVYEQSSKAIGKDGLQKLIVATDSEEIAEHVHSFGGEAVITQADHPSGTDRCFEALQLCENPEQYEYVINIQGDEPLIDPQQILELTKVLHEGEIELATQMIRITNPSDLTDEGEVKIVLNSQQEAMYFSRSAIPFYKNLPISEWIKKHDYYRHVGMYAYNTKVLAELVKLPVSGLEAAESLEQLRWLEAGFKIKCIPTTYESHCVDTPADLEKVIATLAAAKK